MINISGTRIIKQIKETQSQHNIKPGQEIRKQIKHNKSERGNS